MLQVERCPGLQILRAKDTGDSGEWVGDICSVRDARRSVRAVDRQLVVEDASNMEIELGYPCVGSSVGDGTANVGAKETISNRGEEPALSRVRLCHE
jgi:hypothetical protein